MLYLEFPNQSDLSFWHVICKHLARRWRGRGQGGCLSAGMQQMHLIAFLNLMEVPPLQCKQAAQCLLPHAGT